MVEISGIDRESIRIEIDRFGSVYPGGFSVCSLILRRDPTAPLPFGGTDMVRLYNGPRVVWEGYISSILPFVDDNSAGVRVSAVGAWGWLLNTTIDKRWADNRTSADVWVEMPTYYNANDVTPDQVMNVDRLDGRIRIQPRGMAYTAGQYHRLRYSQPTGQTSKRFTWSYEMQEGAQAWSLELFNETSTASVWQILVSGTGTVDHTFATPTQHMFLLLASVNNQTPAGDGAIFGQIDGNISGATPFSVYSETGNINCYEVFRDVRALVSELSADESMISSSLTVSVEPFMTNGHEAYRSILTRIAGYGTASYGAIGYGIRECAQSSDGKPILFAEPWPDVSSYDYEVSLRGQNISGSLAIARDFGGIVNYVVLTYQNGLGETVTLTPADDSTLTDADSVATYGTRAMTSPLSLGQVGDTAAAQYGRRFLAARKTPQVYVSGSIKVKGYIHGKGGERIPVANVRAGERVKIVDFVSDVLDVTGAGYTAVVTFAEYSDTDGGSVTLSFGVPDNLAIMLARAQLIGGTTLLTGEAAKNQR